MTEKHRSAEWQRNSKHVRSRVRAAWAAGDEPECWRCGRPIYEGALFDVGHIDPFGGEGLENLAPEHRGENRRAGGRVGARITNAAKGGSTFQALPWA